MRSLFAIAGVARGRARRAAFRRRLRRGSFGRRLARLRRRQRIAVAAAPAVWSGEGRVGLDQAGVDAIGLGGALGDRREFQRLEEGDQRLASGGASRRSSSGVSTGTSRTSETSCFEVLIKATLSGSVRISRRFGCLISPGAGEQRVEIAIFIDELRGGLEADAARARNIVRRIAGERLHVDDLLGRHAEIGKDFIDADAALLARTFRRRLRRRPDHTWRRPARSAASDPCRRK